MATAASLTLDVWRNDEVYEFPLRVRGPDLTGVAMRAQVRLAPDTPGAPLVDLAMTTNGNAEGIRLAGVSNVEGVTTNDIRIRLNKSTRQALPYSGEVGDSAVLALAFQIAGRTRLYGNLRVLAHAMDSDAAPTNRPASYGVRVASAPSAGASLTIGADDVVELTIDGADLIGSLIIRAENAAANAQAAVEQGQLARISVGSTKYTLLAATGDTDGTAFGPVDSNSLPGYGVSASVALNAPGTGRIEVYAKTSTGAFNLIARSGVLTTGDGTFGSWRGGIDFPRWLVPAGSIVLWRRETGGRILYDNTASTVRYWSVGSNVDAGTRMAGIQVAGGIAFSWAVDPLILTDFAANPVISGYSAAALNPADVSGFTWIDAQPVAQSFRLRRLAAFCRAAGPLNFAFFSRSGNVFTPVIIIPVEMTNAGELEFNANIDFAEGITVAAGLYFGTIPPLPSSGRIGYSNYKSAFSGTMSGNSLTATLTDQVALAIRYEGTAPDQLQTLALAERKRICLYRPTLTAQPDNWVATANPWTYGAGGVTSLGAGQSYGTYLLTDCWTRTERRITRVRFTILSPSTQVGIGAIAPNDGNGRGPSLMVVDGIANLLIIKNRPSGGTDPGNAAQVALPFDLNPSHSYRLEWHWDIRTHSLTFFDETDGWSVSVSYGDSTTQVDTNSPAGNANDRLALFAISGQFTVSELTVLYDRPNVNVLVLGDSKTQGDQLTAPQRWAQMLDGQLGGTVAISAMGGGKALGAYYTARTEIPALSPQWVILTVGTNDQDSGLAAFKAFTSEIIAIAKSIGAKVVLARIKNTSFGTYNQINAFIDAISTADPVNIKRWRWDLVESDQATLQADGVHRSALGEQRVLARLAVDVPEIFD